MEERAPADRPLLAAAALRRVVEILADDSLGGRPTPSRELDVAAGWVSRQFSEAGLVPLGDDGSFFQRFPVAQTSVEEGKAGFEIPGVASWRFGTDYWHVAGMGGSPVGELRAPVAIVTGKVTRENAATLGIKGKIVIFRSAVNARGTPTQIEAGFPLGAAGARAVLIPGRRPDSLWRRIRADPEELKPLAQPAWNSWTTTAPPLMEGAIRFMSILEVWNGRWEQLLTRAAVDTSAFVGAESPPRVTPLASEGVFHFDRKIERILWAPNVVALLEGSDSALKHEYIVVTAHLDGLGRAPNAPPETAILNGADDNASGVAAIVQIAKQMATEARPKRSVVFVAVSGEELGLWGSDYFASRPPVPRAAIAANVNLDMVGRATGDTLFVTGITNEPAFARVRATVVEGRRGMTILDQTALDARYPNERFDERSDHVNFRRRGIPTISFFTGPHKDYHETTDDPATLNYDGLSRVSYMALDVIRALADMPKTRGR